MTADVRTQPYRLYRFYDHAGQLLYIGQTGRQPLVRLIEHLMTQAWAAEIARWEMDPGAWWTEADVLAEEEKAIRTELPIRNGTHNWDNPNQAWVPKVREYRHPSLRHRVPRQPTSQSSHRARPARLTARQERLRNAAALWATLWLAVTLLAAYGLNRAVDQPWPLDLRAATLAGLLPAPLWHGWLLRYLPGVRQSRRQRNAARVVAVALAGAVLWSLSAHLGTMVAP